MPAASNKLCKATVDTGTGTETIYFRTNVNQYTGAFATAVGIEAAGATEQSKPPVDLRRLISAGYLVRMVAITKGTATDPSRQISILCAAGKEAGARAWGGVGTNSLPGVTAQPVVRITNKGNRVRYS